MVNNKGVVQAEDLDGGDLGTSGAGGLGISLSEDAAAPGMPSWSPDAHPGPWGDGPGSREELSRAMLDGG